MASQSRAATPSLAEAAPSRECQPPPAGLECLGVGGSVHLLTQRMLVHGFSSIATLASRLPWLVRNMLEKRPSKTGQERAAGGLFGPTSSLTVATESVLVGANLWLKISRQGPRSPFCPYLTQGSGLVCWLGLLLGGLAPRAVELWLEEEVWLGPRTCTGAFHSAETRLPRWVLGVCAPDGEAICVSPSCSFSGSPRALERLWLVSHFPETP